MKNNGFDFKFIKNLMVYKSILAKDVMTPFSVAVTAEENISIQQFYDQHKNLNLHLQKTQKVQQMLFVLLLVTLYMTLLVCCLLYLLSCLYHTFVR